jgi:hypothetical protein
MLSRSHLLAILTLVLASAPAPGQGAAGARSVSRGMRLAPHLTFASFDLTEEEDSPAEHGLGGGAAVGYGISSRLGVFLSGDLARVEYEEATRGESYTLGSVDIGVRYTAGGSASPLRPYGELAVSRVRVSDDLDGVDYRFTGPGVTAGLGAEYFMSRGLALDASFHATRGRLTDGVFDGDPLEPDDDLLLLRLAVGLAWHPGAVR